jgi:hypothetical protein
MKLLTPFKIASALLFLFFAGHTFGGMAGHKSLGLASDAVFAAMQSVHFTFNGSDVTWYGFWLGFGLITSVFLAFSAIACWQFDRIDPRQWSAVAPIAWALAVAQACTGVLGFHYFFVAPGVMGSIVAVLIVIGILRKQAAARGAPA